MGRIYESRVLGVFAPKDVGAYKKAIEDEKKRLEGGGRLRREDVIRLIRENYGDDPTNPRKQSAKDLRLAVADAMDLSEEELDGLQFFTAVDSPLDEYFGVDAWMEVEMPTGERVMVTLDATLNKEKIATGHKADVLIGEMAQAENDEDLYLEQIDDYAQQIARLLQERIDAQKRRARRVS
jgi:hypothetical protein